MAFESITQKDWYEILGAKPSDSPAELKRKYQKLVLLYHPDKQKADVPAGEVEERVQRFIEIDQAWKILGNEETKKEYDLQQRENNLTKEWPLHARISLEDMSWNEDEQCYTLSCRCGGNYTVFRSETKDVSLVCCDMCSLVIEILQWLFQSSTWRVANLWKDWTNRGQHLLKECMLKKRGQEQVQSIRLKKGNMRIS